MSIAVPSAGDPILDTWGEAVADRYNATTPIIMTATQATNSATAVDITELAVAVVSGRSYNVQLMGAYSVSATNQGLQLAMTHPGGTGVLWMEIAGTGSATGTTKDRVAASTLGGTTASVNTGNLEFWAHIWYKATSSGTLQLQFARGGTSGSTGVTLQAGTGGWVIEGAP